MKKLIVFILSLFLLVGCSKPNFNDLDVSLLNVEPTLSSYREEVQVFNSYEEYKENILNYSELTTITEEFFSAYDLVILLVSSNAEEHRNKVEFTNLEFNNNYEFTFVGKIDDNSTDLAFFLNIFSFKVNKELNMDEENIKINKTTIIK